MLLTSTAFLVFFVFVVVLYFVLPLRFRVGFLLLASYYFYSTYRTEYLILLVILTAFNYYMGILLGKEQSGRRKKMVLTLSLVSNIGVLFWFKYMNVNVFTDAVRTLLLQHNVSFLLPSLGAVLPVGLSFYTFKIMNYTIDVYRGRRAAERKLGVFALYVSFFPQLIAGPIDRATKLLPQFYERHSFDYVRVTDGLRLMLWGFFQKVVIADNLATLVDPVFSNPTQYEGVSLILAVLFFTFQIYCDFSGYSDIAIGAARILGFQSMMNFERPYFSKSIPEFWRTWHISLSSWFRDYLYIPLGGKRVSILRWYFNIFIVFLVSGLWHGSNWTFAVWGAIHGFYYILSVLTQTARDRIHHAIGLRGFPVFHKYLKVICTFSLVSFAWIFFRANSFSDAIYIVTHLFSGWNAGMDKVFSFAPSEFEVITGIISVICMEVIHLIQRHGSIGEMLLRKPLWFRWSLYYAAVLAILLFGNFGVKQFIYFKF